MARQLERFPVHNLHERREVIGALPCYPTTLPTGPLQEDRLPFSCYLVCIVELEPKKKSGKRIPVANLANLRSFASDTRASKAGILHSVDGRSGIVSSFKVLVKQTLITCSNY